MLWLTALTMMVSAGMFMAQFPAMITNEKDLVAQKVLLVIAHPDDEAMFFGPTIDHLVSNNKNNSIHLLCLSTGDSEGLGDTRSAELASSAKILGITSENVTIINDPALPDSMHVEWDKHLISQHIADTASQFEPTVIITFDERGVSGHTNHKQVFWGAMDYALSQYDATAGSVTDSRGKVPFLPYDLTLLTLKTVSITRKYLFVLDAPISRLSNLKYGDKTMLTSNTGYSVAVSAMRLAHRSQMKWFRYLWLYFSRYMLLNDLGTVNLDKAAEYFANQSTESVPDPVVPESAAHAEL